MPTEKPYFLPSSVLHMKNLNKVSDVEPMSLVARQTKCTLKPVFGMGTKKRKNCWNGEPNLSCSSQYFCFENTKLSSISRYLGCENTKSHPDPS